MHSHPSMTAAKMGRTADERATVRTRPTNNQLLYKAYFRWQHYPVPSSPIYKVNETDACASVTAAFLQVMSILQEVEALHCPTQRNVLKILSQDTRHTKVVNLACGTHRVSDELKKHYLTDIEGTQYTTNLDRNRYGADNQYMFTVIRHNLSTLGLCPCLVDVEVLDQKSNETVMVSAGIEACICEEPWHDAKDEKMSCEGRSCSPGSSAQSEEKSSGKSTSFTQTAVFGSCQKQRCSHAPFGEAESIRSTMNNRSVPAPTSVYEFNAAVGLASVNRHFAQVSSRRSKKSNKSASSMQPEILHDPVQQQRKHRFTLNMDQEELGSGYGKRTRENDSADGMHWDFQNSAPSQKSGDPTRPPMGVDYKRMKTSFSQLSFDSERIMDEVLKMKSKLSGMDPLRYQIEEDSARIRHMEGELITLKMEMRRYVSEYRQVESQLLANRRVIGMLLNRLQQSLGGKQEMGADGRLPIASSALMNDRDGCGASDTMESLMTPNGAFPGDSARGMPLNKAIPTMPLPNSMMIALANNVPNGVNGQNAYDSEWISAHSSSANSTSPLNVPGQQQPAMHHALPLQEDESNKRMSSFMNSKIEPQTSPRGFHDMQRVYEFNYGSV